MHVVQAKPSERKESGCYNSRANFSRSVETICHESGRVCIVQSVRRSLDPFSDT